MAKTKSHTEQQAIYAANRDMLIRLMGLRDDDMFSLVYESGMNYLSAQCRHDSAGIDFLKDNSMYWNWWRQQWYIRDAEFIAANELQNGESPDREYAFAVDENGDLTAMTLYGAYRLHHMEAMNHEDLCKSYYRIMHVFAKDMARNKTLFNH